ncbi:cation:proton antiporter [Bifidobacterium eulemuris]|uniref:Cation:proton antiporter n=1 Tax=Bifidobacterium eulemuris TaxID=1765219 RepID=A0A261GDF3_9BIFI|nr:cation:proton antiporter [Bifidobacterium eulemuris]OZG69440.1 potassium transporter [Bifidobacterium eulemuris]QOL32194.1 cation:proton antiporter [Bifidobacterium eulemuris]
MTHDLISLTIIMAVAVICPILAERIPGKPIPQTVLLLVFGMALGPHLLNKIWLTDAVDLLSELGLAFLFLLAGYEIDPKKLGGHQGKVGLLTWVATLAIAWLAVFLVPFFAAHDMNGVAAVITLTTTALGTLMPILKERSLTGTPVGEAVIAYGTWGELGPVLAMAVLLSARSQWQTMLILGLFTLICALAALVPKAARRAGHWLYRFLTENANTSSQTLMRLTVLLLVGLITISRLFDLDVVMGAFAAGFILRFVIPDGNRILETKLEGVAYGFLIPVFFVASGASIDVRAVAANPALLIMFIVMLVLVRAVPVFTALTLDRRANPLEPQDRLTVALYCTTALPVIVAVTSVAVKAGTMQQTTASTLVMAGAVTVFLMPLLGGLAGKVVPGSPTWRRSDSATLRSA